MAVRAEETALSKALPVQAWVPEVKAQNPQERSMK